MTSITWEDGPYIDMGPDFVNLLTGILNGSVAVYTPLACLVMKWVRYVDSKQST